MSTIPNTGAVGLDGIAGVDGEHGFVDPELTR